MGARHYLSEGDREFFTLVAKVIFTNPFSDEWTNTQKTFLPSKEKSRQTTAHFIDVVYPPLNERLVLLEKKGKASLDPYSDKDRELMKHAFLFQAYTNSIPKWDELIKNQIARPSKAVIVPFAKDIIEQLTRRGFSHQDTIRYLGIFYQLRRAFYFISEALIGDSPSMKKFRLALWNNVFSYDVRNYDRFLWNRMEDFSTMLLGETGTGKGAAAAAIGRSSFIPYDDKKGQFVNNFNETFIEINLSQFPETLIESELFGHSKGAFTGAVEDHKGLLERCNRHGALFLDEIGDVSIPIQIKLLKVLQERTFSPVGSHITKTFSGRVIAATNHAIEPLRNDGHFREDFFYRLCSDLITVPTLRQRIEESPQELQRLVVFLTGRMVGTKDSYLASKVLTTLKKDLPANYSWPGNVRELEQAIRRVLLTGSYKGTIPKKANWEDHLIKEMKSGTLTATELISQYCSLLYKQCGTYENVAKQVGLDRRTVKKYLDRS